MADPSNFISSIYTIRMGFRPGLNVKIRRPPMDFWLDRAPKTT